MTDFQPGYQPGYTNPAGMPGHAGYPVPYVRASLGGRTVAYLLDLAFIFVFTALLATAIAILGVLTFGVAWVLFPILGLSGILYSALTVGGPKQSTFGMRMLACGWWRPRAAGRWMF